VPDYKAKYYFPSLLNSIKVEKEIALNTCLTVNIDSGKSALILLLKSYLLPSKSKIALPAFICQSAKTAISESGLQPHLLDLKNDNSFVTDYDLENILQNNVKVVLLAHLYGYIHPDTKRVTEFCFKHNIFIIHDAAQSFGIDESKLLPSNGIIYSFGPGKSSNAAGGACIKNGERDFLKLHDKLKPLNIIEKKLLQLKASNQVKLGIYNYQFETFEKTIFKTANQFIKFGLPKRSYYMNGFQIHAAIKVIQLISDGAQTRKRNHQIISTALEKHKLLSLCYPKDEGLFFKVIIFNNSSNHQFEKYLKLNHIPYYKIFQENSKYFTENTSSSNLPVFKKNACNIFELSSEATIPLEEIQRIASVLKEYKG
jgi:dTDP-4-amino-4,6-dideoxygalactose transaminase